MKSDRGYALWLASKANLLLYAAVMFASFAFYFTIQQDFQGKDLAYRSAENIARLLDSAAASPGDFSQNVTLPGGVSTIAIQNPSGSDYSLQVLVDGKYSAERTIHAKASVMTVQNRSSIIVSKKNGVVSIS
ncbi:hypothetical protein HYS54_02815 [Candidatus Micrarchaeota archaeon]|nr:hypothetical protein [Candidatus Micrarchaeota archaeon]